MPVPVPVIGVVVVVVVVVVARQHGSADRLAASYVRIETA